MLKNKLYVYGDQNQQVPAHLNFGKYILDQLRRKKHEVAIENAETGEKLSYKELTEYAVKCSMVLTKLGVRKGDVVALGTEKRLMLLPTALAIMLSGATYTSYEFNIGRAHLKHKMEMTKPKYMVLSELFWETNQELLQCSDFVKIFITLDDVAETMISVKSLISSIDNVDVNMFEPIEVQGQVDTAVVLYSSGTTGMPKGVQLTHLNCILKTLPFEVKFLEDPVKVVFVIGNWFGSYDFNTTFGMLALGKKVVYTIDLSLKTLVMAFEKTQVDTAYIAPSFVNLLAKTKDLQNKHLECLKYVCISGNTIDKESIINLKDRFKSIKQVLNRYGMTETGGLNLMLFFDKMEPKVGSVVSVYHGHILKVENPETREVLGPNQTGHICVKKGPSFMKGYIDVDPATYLDEEGWFRTGDLGYYDDNGYFYIISRLKDIIIYDGFNVAPQEMETVLMSHPSVLDASVVGKPVPVYGELPTAFVVRQPGSDLTEKELIEFVAPQVAPYMQLKGGVRFISELPRNSRGKVLRQTLKNMLSEDNVTND